VGAIEPASLTVDADQDVSYVRVPGSAEPTSDRRFEHEVTTYGVDGRTLSAPSPIVPAISPCEGLNAPQYECQLDLTADGGISKGR
jgi:hypothetical protein